MPSDLDGAAKRFHRAQRTLAEARQRVLTARADVEQARAELATAIVGAARAGMRQVEIVQISGYTRENVRRILRSAGVEPD